MQPETQGAISTPSLPERKQLSSRKGLTLLLICLLLIGGIALLFSKQITSNTRTLPTTIHWQQVLQHYLIASLVAAPGNPTILYACGEPLSSDGMNLNALLSPTPLSQDQQLSGPLLRSTDAGVHWQPLTVSLGDGLDCSIAVNPKQANDLYVSSTSFGANTSTILKHSSDGGQTWTTIPATLTLPDGQDVAWDGVGVRFVGNHLFGAQIIHNTPHLISSVDGGRTWRVVDARISNADQSVRSSTVDPADPNIIYALVGRILSGQFSYAAGGATPPPMPSPIPAAQLVSHLYKTTNGGASWREILSDVPYGSSVQIASANPNQLYVGGLTGGVSISSPGTFHMQRSSDGGASWQAIAIPANLSLLGRWIIGASGLLYGIIDSYAASHAGNKNVPVNSIQRYDPSDHQWSTLAMPSATDTVFRLALTVDNGDVLWAINLDGTLYRGTLS